MASRTPGFQSIHFARYEGIVNAKPRTELKPTELWRAVNVDLDSDGYPFLCPGYTKLLSVEAHSIFSDNRTCVAVIGGSLYIVNSDLTTTLIAPLLSNTPMAYAVVNARIYYTNGVDIGYVERGQAWIIPRPTDPYKRTPPPGQVIGFYNGRIYTCAGKVMYFTDPMKFNSVDMRNGFKSFPSDILLWAAVDTGIYVSDQECVWYLGGASPNKMTWRKVTDYPAIPGTAVLLDNKLFGRRPEDRLVRGRTVAFNTTRGICTVTNDGVLENLTARKYIGATGIRGASVQVRGEINKLITIVQQ